MHIVRILLTLLLVILVHGSIDWYYNQPQDAGTDVPAGKLMSLSFAPFREGYSPLEKIYPLPEHIEADMQLLADKTQSIRTYSSLDGMQPTPDIARKYGVKMIQGGWLGNGLKINQMEMQSLIESANKNPDVVQRVIVGNEVLLRGDLDVDHLIAYIRQVKQAVKQPVSYADVWSMYMKYPQLIKEVDFITIHILPYWEDEPISVEHAAEHLEKIVKQVEDEARGIAPGKPILIGESGWPSAGRQRGMATPGVINEARFIRNLIQVAQRHGFDYNIVEAFNQPWKSNLEGVVGANWGLYSVAREPVFPLTGAVYEQPQWLSHALQATLLLLGFIAVYFRRLQNLSSLRLVVLLGIAQLFSIFLVDLAHFLWYTSYSQSQRAYTIIMVAANAILGSLILQRNYNLLTDRSTGQALAFGLRLGYQLFVLLALYKTWGLAANGRYLSFPVEQFLIPVFGLLSMTVSQWLSQGRFNSNMLTLHNLTGCHHDSGKIRLLAWLLSFSSIALILGETKAFLDGRDFIQAHPGLSEGLPVALSYTLHNQQLLAWLGCLLLLSIPLWCHKKDTAQGGRTA